MTRALADSTDRGGQRVGVGVIGVGGIARLHVEGYRVAGAEVVALADIDPHTLAGRQAEWGVEAGYIDYHDLLRDPNVEAVSVTVPNALHHPITLAAAAQGKHVLCEKPISLSLELAQEMIDACRAAGVVLQIGHQFRSSGAAARAKAMIDAGELGRITFVRLRQAHDWAGAREVSANFGTVARAGGGTLLDNGTHMMDLARYFGGPVREVFARTATLKFDVEVEDTSLVSLLFESGALGSVENAWTATGWEEGFWIYGTEGALESSNRQGTPVLRHSYRASLGTTWGDTDVAVYDFAGGSAHARHIRNFLRAVRGEGEVLCTGEDGLEAVRLVLASYQSARRGGPIVTGEAATA